MPTGTQKAPSTRTVGDFGQSLAFPHVSGTPVLCMLVLAVWHLLHTRPSDVMVGAYRHSDGTQWGPSARTARTAGESPRSLAFLHVSHPPALCALVLAVQCFLHARLPTRMPGVSALAPIGTQKAPSGTPVPEL